MARPVHAASARGWHPVPSLCMQPSVARRVLQPLTAVTAALAPVFFKGSLHQQAVLFVPLLDALRSCCSCWAGRHTAQRPHTSKMVPVLWHHQQRRQRRRQRQQQQRRRRQRQQQQRRRRRHSTASEHEAHQAAALTSSGYSSNCSSSGPICRAAVAAAAGGQEGVGCLAACPLKCWRCRG